MVVPGSDDDTAGLDKRVCALLEKLAELVVECLVNLIQHEDVRVGLLSDGEPEPGLHPLRVRQDRTFERLAESAPLLDGAKRPCGGTTGKSSEDAEQQRIFATRQQREQPGVDREQGSNAPPNLDPPAIGRIDTCEDAEAPGGDAGAAEARLSRGDNPEIAVEEELHTDVLGDDHQMTFAN